MFLLGVGGGWSGVSEGEDHHGESFGKWGGLDLLEPKSGGGLYRFFITTKSLLHVTSIKSTLYS